MSSTTPLMSQDETFTPLPIDPDWCRAVSDAIVGLAPHDNEAAHADRRILVKALAATGGWGMVVSKG